MKIDGVTMLTADEARDIKNYENFILLMYRFANFGLISPAEAGNIHFMTSYNVFEGENIRDKGSYASFIIGTKEIYLNSKCAVPDPAQYNKLFHLVNDAMNVFKEQGIDNSLLKRHLILNSTNIFHLFDGEETLFPPIQKNDAEYFKLLKETADRDIFKARFAMSFFDHGYNADQALGMVDIPKEWFDEIFAADNADNED